MYVCVCMYLCVCEYVYVCVCTCMCVCMYMYVCVCVCVCVCVSYSKAHTLRRLPLWFDPRGDDDSVMTDSVLLGLFPGSGFNSYGWSFIT